MNRYVAVTERQKVGIRKEFSINSEWCTNLLWGPLNIVVDNGCGKLNGNGKGENILFSLS